MAASALSAAAAMRRALKEQTGVIKYGTIISRVTSHMSGLPYVITTTDKGLPITESNWSVLVNVQASPWNVSRIFAR